MSEHVVPVTLTYASLGLGHLVVSLHVLFFVSSSSPIDRFLIVITCITCIIAVRVQPPGGHSNGIYYFFHCKLIALTQTVLHVLGKNIFTLLANIFS